MRSFRIQTRDCAISLLCLQADHMFDQNKRPAGPEKKEPNKTSDCNKTRPTRIHLPCMKQSVTSSFDSTVVSFLQQLVSSCDSEFFCLHLFSDAAKFTELSLKLALIGPNRRRFQTLSILHPEEFVLSRQDTRNICAEKRHKVLMSRAMFRYETIYCICNAKSSSKL